MNPATLPTLSTGLIAIAVAVFIVVRQFSTRRVALAWLFLPPMLIGVYGLTSVGSLSDLALAVLALNMALAAGLGVLRATTFRLWVGADGELLSRGSLLTVIFWAVTIAARFGVYAAEQRAGLPTLSSGSELLIPVAATLLVQNAVLYLRSQRLHLAATA